MIILRHAKTNLHSFAIYFVLSQCLQSLTLTD